MSTFTYLLAVVAVVAALSGRAECRPQTPETKDAEVVGGEDQWDRPVFLDEKYGAFVGEVITGTDHIIVAKRQKKRPRGEPSASALVAGPSVGVSAGLSLVPTEAKVELAAAR